MDTRRYVLRFVPDSTRIAFVTAEENAMPDDTIVDALPDGDITQYRYENGQFICSPPPPEYPRCEKDTAAETVFMLGDGIYRARTAIAIGEPVTPYNSEQLTPADILNALAEQRGE